MATSSRMDTGPAPYTGDGIGSERWFALNKFPLFYSYTFQNSADNISTTPIRTMGRMHFTVEVKKAPAAATISVKLQGSISGNTYEDILTASAEGFTAPAAALLKVYQYVRITVASLANAEGLLVYLGVTE